MMSFISRCGCCAFIAVAIIVLCLLEETTAWSQNNNIVVITPQQKRHAFAAVARRKRRNDFHDNNNDLLLLRLKSSFYNNDNNNEENIIMDDDIMDEEETSSAAVRWKVSPPPPSKISSIGATQLQETFQYKTTTTTTSTKTSSQSTPIPSPILQSPTGSAAVTNNFDDDSSLKQFSPPRQLRIERFARLPVWPVWSGVLLFLLGLVFGKENASRLEMWMGGRVCPMILHQDNDKNQHSTTSPFLLLVHHNHRFPWWDAIGRTLTKQFLPEGFPAHPHRGFTTLTYILQGGFVHRDSMGIQQEYGDENNNNENNNNNNSANNNNNIYHPVQWLFTGAGLLHEEMFSQAERQELYQMWINVPAAQKMGPPQVKVLATTTSSSTSNADNNDAVVVDMPVLTTSTVSMDEQQKQFVTTKSTVRILAGTYQGKSSTAPTMSDMNILHVTVKTFRNRRTERKVSLSASDNDNNDVNDRTLTPFAAQHPAVGWTYTIPPNYDTLLFYIRQGFCHISTSTTSRDRRGNIQTRHTKQHRVPMHSTVFVEPSIEFQGNCKLLQETITITPSTLGETVDVLLLAGQPLYETFDDTTTTTYGMPSLQQQQQQRTSTTLEPIAMQGSMVMNYPHEIQQAYQDYQRGQMGRPWDHQMSDEEWKRHVTKFPNVYYYSDGGGGGRGRAVARKSKEDDEYYDYY
jgi:redox-sensitive bicupin YhaK (pirin superfamily)